MRSFAATILQQNMIYGKSFVISLQYAMVVFFCFCSTSPILGGIILFWRGSSSTVLPNCKKIPTIGTARAIIVLCQAEGREWCDVELSLIRNSWWQFHATYYVASTSHARTETLLTCVGIQIVIVGWLQLYHRQTNVTLRTISFKIHRTLNLTGMLHEKRWVLQKMLVRNVTSVCLWSYHSPCTVAFQSIHIDASLLSPLRRHLHQVWKIDRMQSNLIRTHANEWLYFRNRRPLCYRNSGPGRNRAIFAAL